MPDPSPCRGPNVPAFAKLASAAPRVLRQAATASPPAPIAATGPDTSPDATGCFVPHGPAGGRMHASTVRVVTVAPRAQTASDSPFAPTSKARLNGPAG